MPNLIGQTVGRYRIVARLGQGGMAEVYKAYHPGLDRYVAIKVMHSHLASDESFVGRFEREARSVYDLRHQNIVQVFDLDEHQGLYYMAMEFIDGPTLKDEMLARAEAGQPLSLEETGRIFITLCEGIDFAHRKGMVHRDLKPANFMLNKAGQILILDFGIAKILGQTTYTLTGSVTGTPAYMSPEQGQGKRGDERSDIYSLGVILFEMVTGRVPYDGDTPFGVIFQHINDPLPMPREILSDIPEDIEAVILKAMEKEPADRYQSALEFADAVRHALGFSSAMTLNRMPVLPIATPPEINELAPDDPTFTPPPVGETDIQTMQAGLQSTMAMDEGQPETNKRAIGIIIGVIALLLVVGFFMIQGQNQANENEQATADAVLVMTADANFARQTQTAEVEAQLAAAIPTNTALPTETPIPTETPDTDATIDARLDARATSAAEQTATAVAELTTAAPPPTETVAATETDAPAETPTPVSATATAVVGPPTGPPTNTPIPETPTTAPTPTPNAPQVSGKIAVPISSSGGYGVNVYSASDGQLLGTIQNARQPDFRADGVKLLVNGQGGGRDNVWELNGSSYQFERSVSSSPSDFHPFYSPDGQRLVIGNDNFAVGSDGSNHPFIFVQCGVRNPQEEAEETCQSVAQFLVLVPDGQIGEIHGSNPVWTGSDLIVYKGCNTWQGGNSCGIFQVGSWANKRSSNGVTPAKIGGIDGTNAIPTDAEGTNFLFHDRQNNDWDVYISSVNGGPANLSNSANSNDGLGTFSPDGQWVAFVSDRGGSWAVWATSVSGGTASKLFDIPWGGPIPDWLNERISWGP